MRIFFVCPTYNEAECYIQVTWAGLKSYHDKYSKHAGEIEWLYPVHDVVDDIEKYKQKIDFSADILALSFYCWNHELQCEIAREYRRRNPNGIIITGGPDLPYKDSAWMKENPWLDVHVPLDGEISFTEIVDTLLEGGSLYDVEGIIIPDGKGYFTKTGPEKLLKEWHLSPLLEEFDFFQGEVDKFRSQGKSPTFVYETTRGCPYSCTFCDWGGGIMQKLRFKTMDMVKQELDKIMTMGFDNVWITDANFGILKRDIDIAQYMHDNNDHETGLKGVITAQAKNANERNVIINKLFFRARLRKSVNVGLQDTDEDVLAAIKRQNISVDKQIKLAQEFEAEGLPLRFDWILGMPEQTPEKVVPSICRLFESNLHQVVQVNPCQVLPNAPMGDWEYMEKHGIKTVKRPMYGLTKSKAHINKLPNGEYEDRVTSRGHYLVACNTFTAEEWVDMWVDSNILVTLHGSGLTQPLSIGLRETKGLPYADFYNMILNTAFRRYEPFASWRKSLYDHTYKWVFGNNPYMPIELDSGIKSNPHLYGRQMVHAYFLLSNTEVLFAVIREVLRGKFGIDEEIEDLINYNRNIVPDPSFIISEGREFKTEFDWYDFFQQIGPGSKETPTLYPLPPHLRYEVKDDLIGREHFKKFLNWEGVEEEDRRNRHYFHSMCFRWEGSFMFNHLDYKADGNHNAMNQLALSA